MSGAADAPAISIITTCKGRLGSLRQSLPLMAAQPRAEVIVVDYDCPEASGAWAASGYPAARVVRVQDAPIFNRSRAHNLGAQAARGAWLCFVDADVLLAGLFLEELLPQLREGAFYVTSGKQREVYGTIVCLRQDYVAVEGYDEVLEGWGTEDRDFYLRLELLGRARQVLPEASVTAIEHDGGLRVRYHELKDQWLNQRINALYVQIKHDLVLQLGKLNLPLDVRRDVYSEVSRALRRAAETGQQQVRMEIVLPGTPVVRFYDGWQMRRVWTYLLEAPAQQQPETAAGAGAAVVAPSDLRTG